ncbi:signal peptidase I [Clostridium chauvoei]|uniref:Signal peptidase I n=2 Tax=Clostridium chauvoei TaxID=46867 RepID=S6EHE0_9CLOT|nr:signal peptidase I [Clostridium chauvoei]ATD54139.1 signal peptidase I [Clostridium chauvoei]ATD58414.1 signal peptidase I [Clostridium chauvoei]MBX7281678.1 signal peptidase I [Clostridium chauvoei]MBX7284183.1 signal peptidase I [Clostridium chauvoei]MBX7286711.1 signal peptidase I [Clostridium chauvoei]
MLEKFQELLNKLSEENLQEGKKSSSTKDYVKIIGISLLIAILVNKFIFFKARVPTSSMVPTLNIGDIVLVNRLYKLDLLERGDLVVFFSEEKGEYMVKRLIGLPGDYISISSGDVYINGEYLEEDYVQSKDDFIGSYTVPEDKYFFLGDNRPISLDSRRWKNTYIDGKKIIGIVKFRIYPIPSIGSIK